MGIFPIVSDQVFERSTADEMHPIVDRAEDDINPRKHTSHIEL